MWRTKWEGFHLRRPRVYADRVRLRVYAGRFGDREHHPVHAGRPGDRAIIQQRMRRGLSYLDARHETYDRTMTDRYAEGTPQQDLDPEAGVNAAGGPRKGRVYGFGDSLDTTPVLSSYTRSVAPPAYASSSAAPPGSGGEDMRTLIREELQT
ncbi:hypothetical protein Taro_046315 [Colocasia esculenta]|uniref:Uncharacterized protein n=1 Tax=Colocasia esculenta TaxID=4460 RepID=A0A843X7A5_COLES|nr:hypothetical protein [Colocasia esculenta]